MADTEDVSTWVSEYDYPNRKVSLTLAGSGLVGHHWSGIRKDESLSDPAGAFDVFIANSSSTNSTDDAAGPVVKIVARLDEEGEFARPHPDFNTSSIGSMTIWPYKVAGERFELAHWMWWASGPVFCNAPRPWAEAMRDR